MSNTKPRTTAQTKNKRTPPTAPIDPDTLLDALLATPLSRLSDLLPDKLGAQLRQNVQDADRAYCVLELGSPDGDRLAFCDRAWSAFVIGSPTAIAVGYNDQQEFVLHGRAIDLLAFCWKITQEGDAPRSVEHSLDKIITRLLACPEADMIKPAQVIAADGGRHTTLINILIDGVPIASLNGDGHDPEPGD